MKESVRCLLVVVAWLLFGGLALAPEILAWVQAGVIEPEPTEPQTPEQVENDIDIVAMSPIIVLKGQVNGNHANVMFDTGGWPNAIGNHMSSGLSGPIASISAAGQTFDVCHWDNLAVGGLKSADSGKICLLDLSPLTEGTGIRIDAIAGTPFAFGRVFNIDFEHSTFRVHEIPAGPHEIVIDLDFDDIGRPWVELTIGSHKNKFLVDTGFGGFISVSESLADTLKDSGFAKVDREAIMQVYADGITTRRMLSLSLEKQVLFGYEFRNLPVLVCADPADANTIGLGLLKAFHVSLDLKHAKLRLNKNGIYMLSDGCTVSAK